MAFPTPTPSFSTTCLVFSQPASTMTLHHSSGETGLFPATTYTAPTTELYTQRATIKASCFTLAPGQTIPPSLFFVGASCSTDSRPGSTETTTYSYTPGEPLVAFGRTLSVYTGTTTRYITATHTYDPQSYVYCQPLPDVWNPATCHTVTPLTWATLAVTFLAVQLSWWLFDVPLLWQQQKKKNNDNKPPTGEEDDDNDRPGGLSGFLLAVAWACVRANAPGCAALYALAAGRDTGEYAAMYYLGVRRGADGRAPRFSAWKLATSVGADLLSVVAAGMTVYQACTASEFSPKRFGASLWAYPSLPTALIGLSLLVGRRWFPRTRRAAQWLVFMVVAVVVLVGVALALILWRFAGADELWFISVIFYATMAFPAVVCPGPWILLAIGYGMFARVGGVSIAAWQHQAGGEPYCMMPGIGFAVVYITLGGISALLALFGIVRFYRTLGERKWYKSLEPQAVSQSAVQDGAILEGEKKGARVV